jgi:predicted ferric reductase
MRRLRAMLIWTGLAALMAVPVAVAAASPFLAYRNLPYILGGFAGIVCLSLLLAQPLLAAGYLPGLRLPQSRRWHRWTGAAIVVCVVVHIAGLYVTSPPDTLDALLLVSPTPFSVYGVTAMWGIVITAVLVALRRRLRVGYPAWRLVHNAIALVVVVATVIHAVQIEGAMGIASKWVLCIAVLLATVVALLDVRIVRPLQRWRAQAPRRLEDNPR